MATTPKTGGAGAPHQDEQSNPFQALWKHMQANPLHYIGGGVFVVAVLLFTGLYQIAEKSNDRQLASAYAEAVLLEDPGERAEALAPLAAKKTDFAPYALYMRGEALLSARDYPAATAAFTELRETYPDFPFVPDAVEGLGFVEEDQGNTDAAIDVYREVFEKWPNTPAGRRQPFNIARCLESSNDVAGAIEYYREQLEVFPGSTVGIAAQQRLTTLRSTHPELFEDELNAFSAGGAEEISPDPVDAEGEEADASADEPEESGPAESDAQNIDSTDNREATPELN